jgi:hypothetical protein
MIGRPRADSPIVRLRTVSLPYAITVTDSRLFRALGRMARMLLYLSTRRKRCFHLPFDGNGTLVGVGMFRRVEVEAFSGGGPDLCSYLGAVTRLQEAG